MANNKLEKAPGFTDISLKGGWYTFSGRLNRGRYFMRLLPVVLLMGALYYATLMGGPVWIHIFYIPLIISLASLVSRRAHDTGHKALVPIILTCTPLMPLVVIYYMFKNGQHGTNAYGMDPLEYPFDIR
jgi:uncharacterized membrane protein YhaH (DUF805 family)